MFNIKKLSDNIDYSTIKNKYINTFPVSLEDLLNHRQNENTNHPFK